MPKTKQDVFDVPQVEAQEQVEAPKKRRKRKPMTDEQKKAFSEKMKNAKLAKAQALAEKIIQDRGETPTAKPKASKPKPQESVPVPTQSRASSSVGFDSKHFDNLSNHIQQLNTNLLNLQNYRSKQQIEPKPQAKQSQQKPLSPVEEQPQENIEMKVEPQVEKKVEKKVTIQEPQQQQVNNRGHPPPVYASAKPERRKVYNVRTKKYVYV